MKRDKKIFLKIEIGGIIFIIGLLIFLPLISSDTFLIFFITFIILFPIFLIIYLKIKEEIIKKWEKEAEKIKKFKKSNEYVYLSKFVNKYFNELESFFSEIERLEKLKEESKKSKEPVDKFISKTMFEFDISFFETKYKDILRKIDLLKETLEKKGWSFLKNELIELIEDEFKRQEYGRFKKRINGKKRKKLETYIRDFLETYWEEYENVEEQEKYLNFLKKFLEEKGFKTEKEELENKIREIKKEMEISRFEKKLFEKEKQLTIEEIELMNGYEFEKFLKRLFEKMGYKVIHTSLSKDQGADLILSKFGEKIVVQAKRYSNKVGNRAIQEVVAAIKHYKADKAMVICTSNFTRSAIELAESNNIKLIDRDGLNKLIDRFL